MPPAPSRGWWPDYRPHGDADRRRSRGRRRLSTPADSSAGSVARVRAALLAAGHPDTITAFPEGTRSAAEAASAIGCDVAQIAKSIVFRAGGQAAIVVASGAVRVDVNKAATILGCRLDRANAAFVRSTTGFAIGGVAPVAHSSPCLIVLDEMLLSLDPVWAAAGSPSHVFSTTAEWLGRLTGARFADVAEPRDAPGSP